jgi:predicted nucleic acid-binding protein
LPLMENDIIFAYLNKLDRNHETAAKLMQKLGNGEIIIEFSSVALVEMELVYMSQGLENRLVEDLATVAALPGIHVLPLTPDIAVAAAYLRETHDLSFFDSHYTATSLAGDGEIISFDAAYDRVPGITRTDPAKA